MRVGFAVGTGTVDVPTTVVFKAVLVGLDVVVALVVLVALEVVPA